jgi:DNA (cytosine-5)-methyltransferase 1
LTARQLRRPIAVDLFAGAGGLSLGFEQAGFDIVASVELDPIHATIHELNFPETRVICADVRETTGASIRAAAGLAGADIDVVVGGPPCQGFSLIGYRVLDDPRNALVTHFLRIVEELQPRMFVMENVPGMGTGAHTQLLDELIEGFHVAGYAVATRRILQAAEYGVPQDRRRLFLLGARRGICLPTYPEPHTRLRSKAPRQNGVWLQTEMAAVPECPSVADAILDLPNVDHYPHLFVSDVLDTETGEGSPYARVLHGVDQDPGDYSYPRRWTSTRLTGCLRARHTALSIRRFRETTPGTTEPISRFFRLSLNGVCNTLRAGTATDRGAFSAPRPIHPLYPRCITVREAARLHSFPDWFRFHRTIWHGFRQIGNSVPPLLGRAVGAEVIRALRGQPARPARALVLGEDALAAVNMRAAAERFRVPYTVIPPRLRTVQPAGAEAT